MNIQHQNGGKTRRLGGYIGVFSSLVAILVLTPLFTREFYSYVGMQVCLTLLLMSITYSLVTTYSVLYAGIFIIAGFILFDWLGILYNSYLLMGTSYALFSLYLLMAIILLFNSIVKAPKINTDLIFGALTMYFLIGIFWAKLFFIENLFFPNSFHGILPHDTDMKNLSDSFTIQFNLLYYSYTTLATLGIGDITPIHHLSKSLTILEAMFGQLFIATVFAKMVSVWHPRRQVPEDVE